MHSQTILKRLAGALAIAGAASFTSPVSVAAHDHDKQGEHDKQDKHDKDKIELEGTVSNVRGSCPELRFEIGNSAVRTGEKTKFENGACHKVQDGSKVEVEGKTKGDALFAYEVELSR